MGELTTLLVQAVIIVSGDQLHEGRWELLLQNAGVSAMHMTLTHTNKLLIFDQKLAGSSQIVRTDPPCNNATVAASEDCEAHSIEYDIATNRVRPLHLLTDTFCSSAAFASNGTLIHTGGYRFSGVPFPTELRVEAYIPYYLHSHYDPKRVNITAISTREIKYGSKSIVRFFLRRRPSVNIDFHAYAPPFTTHSLSMNQRMLSLAATAIVKDKDGYSVGLTAPPSAVVAPSGYYLLTIVNGGVPSKAEWIHFIS